MFRFNSDFTSSDPVNKNGGGGFASFLLDYGHAMTQSTPALVASQQIYPAFCAQDQFKITPKLTLSLGVRWEQTDPTRTLRPDFGLAILFPHVSERNSGGLEAYHLTKGTAICHDS
jgi:hypothetical protein